MVWAGFCPFVIFDFRWGSAMDELDEEEGMLRLIKRLDDQLDNASEPWRSVDLSEEPDNDKGSESNFGFSHVSASSDAAGRKAEDDNGFKLDHEKYNRALQGAVSTTQSFALDMQQPWEKGPMKLIFQKSPQLDFNCTLRATYLGSRSGDEAKHAVQSTDQHASKKLKSGPLKSSFVYYVKCKPDLTFLDKKAADMKLAVGKIVALIEMCPNSFQIGRVVLEENEAPDEQALALQETVEVVLSMKSPNTVNKRAGSLLLYVKWFLDNKRGEPFPILEKDVAAYLFYLRRSGSFISRGASFRESLRFAHYTLGLDGAISACDSPRIKGAADAMLCRNGTWSPADPLFVSEVMTFHNILEDRSKPVLDRIAAGNVLTMIYGRCRASDLALIKSVKLDYGPDSGYLELGTQHHKSSRKATLKRKLLPIVIPVVGINKQNWVELLLGLRKSAGLNTQDLDNEPWWPAPLEADGDAIKWGNRPVASDEISSWMVATLNVEEDQRKISSHSAKVTCLSWLSKAGVGREDRDVLGRHVTILHGAGPLYARDLLSAPLRKLEETISQVASKVFLPDQNRSGMFTPTANPATPQVQQVQAASSAKREESSKPNADTSATAKEEETVETITIDDPNFSDIALSEISISDSEVEESDVSNAEDEQIKAISQGGLPVKQALITFVSGSMFFMHRKSKICHYRDRPLTVGGGMNFLECGRKLSDNFEQIPSVDIRSFKCSLCFKNRL